MNPKILFQDEHILIVDKPADVLVHHSHFARNNRNETTLIELLKSMGLKDFNPINRLDKRTSGIVVLCNDKDVTNQFQSDWNNVQKHYTAIVRGHITENITVDSPVKGRDANVHKEALTTISPLKTSVLPIPTDKFSESRFSLVSLIPETGRLHQLRIHCNKISHPIIGDKKYGDRFYNRLVEEQTQQKRLFLHANKLIFEHPENKKSIEINCQLPNEFLLVKSKLEL